jgi:hypothetical protein
MDSSCDSLAPIARTQAGDSEFRPTAYGQGRQNLNVPLVVPAELIPKAQRWLRALYRQTSDTWRSQSDDAESVAMHLALAVTAVRVLDLEVFDAAHGSIYRARRDADPRGEAINGMTLVRNAEVHLPITVEPTSDPVVGSSTTPKGRSRRYVFWNAHWGSYADLPSEVRENTRTARRCHQGYERQLQHREVTETLLDVIEFFDELDPSATPRTPSGSLPSFPLRPAKGTLWDYHRMHPTEPPVREVERRLREAVIIANPGGRWREIHYAIRSPTGEIVRYAGFEDAPRAIAGARAGAKSWVDFPNLVQADVARGYPYSLVGEAGHHRPVESQDGVLVVGAQRLDQTAIPDIPHEPDWWLIHFLHSNDRISHARNRGIDWRDVVEPDELTVRR